MGEITRPLFIFKKRHTLLTHADIAVTKLGTFKGHRDSVFTLEAAPERGNFFSAGGDGMVVRWSLYDPDRGVPIVQVPHSVYALCCLAEQNRLVAGHNFEGLHLIDLDKKGEIRSLKITSAPIFSIVRHEKRLFAACGDGTVVETDTELKRVVRQVRLSDKSARALAYNPQRSELAVGYSDHTVRILAAEALTPLQKLQGHTGSVFGLAFTPDFELLASVGRDAHMKFWKADGDYELFDDIVAHGYAIHDAAFSADRPYFATASTDKTIRLWNGRDRTILKVIDKARYDGHSGSVNKLLFLPGNPDVFASCGDDRTIRVWQTTILKY